MVERSPDRLTTFGELLRYLRRRVQLTQSELGVALGYSAALITRLENGERLPDLALVKSAYLQALGLEHEPELAARLIELAAAARYEPRHGPALPVPAQAKRLHNLPRQLTSFIGRERGLTDLSHLLAHDGARLVTLTGPGGVGKTRLALHLALQLAERVTPAYPHGVWLVELAPLSNATLAPAAVASVLGVREEPGRPILHSLVEHIRELNLLLILDNCEHLIETAAQVAEAVLRECRDIRILATSRESLGLPGERVWRVSPLQIPDPTQQLGPIDLAQVEAVRLFCERAAAVLPTFVVTTENMPAICAIARRLDGIPLAIELAAARAKALSVEDIAARLDDRFQLLTSGSRTAPPRHKTLRGVVEWSHDLLSMPERALFRRLAVFAGGWTLAAAEAVCADKDEVGRMNEEGTDSIHHSAFFLPTSDVLDLLARLADKSLVVMTPNAGGVSGLMRYHFLETLHQYAHERLVDSGEEARAREQHVSHFIALGEAVTQAWANPTPDEAVESQAKRMDLDFENVRRAFEWAREAGHIDDAIHLIEAYWLTLFIVRPMDQQLLRWLQRLVAHPAARETTRLGRAYLMLWELYFPQSQLEEARAATARARQIGLALQDADILAQADYQQALEALQSGDYPQARDIFDRLVAAGARMRDDWLYLYGILALYEGDYPRARDDLMEFYTQLHARTSNKAFTAGSGRLLGVALARLGQLAEAAPLLRDSLLDNQAMGDDRAVAASLAACATLALAQGDGWRAARLLGAAEGLIESIHDFLQHFDRMLFYRCLAELRERLDEATLSALWAAGRAMTPQQAVEYAVSGGGPIFT